MRPHARLVWIGCALSLAAACGGGTSTASSPTPTPLPVPTLASCQSWAGQQGGAGVPAAPANVASQRQALLAAGGGIRALNGKYYAAHFPSSFASSSVRRVMVALHGTGGSPEAEWNDWTGHLQSRGWGYLGLKYLANAQNFVVTYGGHVERLYRDPAGTHGGLTRNDDALRSMFAYFDSLR